MIHSFINVNPGKRQQLCSHSGKNRWDNQTDPTWYLGTSLGTSEPFRTFTWNPYWEPRHVLGPFRGTLAWIFGIFRTWNPLLEPSLGTLTWNLATFWNLYLALWNLLESGNLYFQPLLGASIQKLHSKPLLGTSEPSATFTWNSYLERQNLDLEPSYPEPWNLLDPLVGTLTWNLGTFRNLCLEPRNLAEPCGMAAPECPRASFG